MSRMLHWFRTLTVWLQILASPLYRNLSDVKQRQVFNPTPKNKRKIVVSTNIAETGLTIPNIVYVIDAGLQKEKNVVPLASGGSKSFSLREYRQRIDELLFLQLCPLYRVGLAARLLPTNDQVVQAEQYVKYRLSVGRKPPIC